MSRHQIPRHAKRRLTIAAIAATALIGTTVTVGIMGIASAGEEGDQSGALSKEECIAIAEQIVAAAQEEEEEQAPPEEGEEGGEEAPPEEGGEEAPPEEGGEEAPPAEEGGEEAPPEEGGEEAPPAEEGGEEAPPAEEEQPQPQTYNNTAPQAANPDLNADENGEEGGEQPPAEEGGEEAPPAEEGGEEAPPAEEGGEEAPPEEGGEEAPPAEEEEGEEGGEEEAQELPAECNGPFAEDFVNIADVEPGAVVQPEPGEGASTGTFTQNCGVDNGFRNSDNFIAAPGVVNGAQHEHNQVGNLNSNANSNDDNLVGAGTSCEATQDESTYFWPVLRLRGADPAQDAVQDEANPHNTGELITATSAELQFKGNEQSEVVAMPQFLRVLTGDAKSLVENGPANSNAKWTCAGQEERIATDKYPVCGDAATVRISNFPSCWDGQNTDSANHRDHIVFKDEATGACPEGTVAVPELQITTTYDIPAGQSFAVDAFPNELHDPSTDHNDFVNVMNEDQMQAVVDAINSGEQVVN
jgi:hypothetical protein